MARTLEAKSHLLHGDITEQIIAAAFEVHRILGFGFLERVYQRALQAELVRLGLRATVEHPIKVLYKGVVVGEYQADVFVNELIIVELKIAKHYNQLDEAQLLNELKATGSRVGLLINFGREKVEFRRFVV
jgi:GxxExxY protein